MEEQIFGKGCLLCRVVNETVEHFVMECGGLRETIKIYEIGGGTFV